MNNQVETSGPLVSVCPITYNHAKYFSQAIESVLSQKVNFEFEIIIGEDESSDGTREVALDYQRKYPGKIRVLLHNRRDVIYINGRATGRWNFVDTLSHARGKYIALLPCDDFWTDPNKLQKQVDVMEAHPEYSVCGHWVVDVDENGSELDSAKAMGKACPEIFTARQALEGTPLHPNSLLFRRFDLTSHPAYSLFLKLPAGDDPLMLMLLGRGNGYCFKEFMGVYRIHSGGAWTSKSEALKEFEMLTYYYSIPQLLGVENHADGLNEVVHQAEIRTVKSFLQSFMSGEWKNLMKIVRESPLISRYQVIMMFPRALYFSSLDLVRKILRKMR